MLKRHIAKRNDPLPPRTLNELKIAARETWEAIPQHLLDNLIESMPRRLTACIKARGGNADY